MAEALNLDELNPKWFVGPRGAVRGLHAPPGFALIGGQRKIKWLVLIGGHRVLSFLFGWGVGGTLYSQFGPMIEIAYARPLGWLGVRCS